MDASCEGNAKCDITQGWVMVLHPTWLKTGAKLKISEIPLHDNAKYADVMTREVICWPSGLSAAFPSH